MWGEATISGAIDDFLAKPRSQRMLTIVVLGVVLQGALIAVDQAAYHGLLGIEYTRGPDLDIFRDRADTILSGGLLYRDVHTETPPVVNYALVIPVLMGGSLLAFQVFFAACNIAVALLLLETHSRRDERMASMVAVLYLINPFTFYHATFNPQDEPLVVLFFLLPLSLLVMDRYMPSAIALGAGIWAKMWPLLLVPLYLLEKRSWSDRLKAATVVAAVSAVIIVPFIVLCPGEFSWFLKFYFLGVDSKGSGGLSLWRFLDQAGLKPPSYVMLALVGAAVVGGYWYSARWEWGPWRTTALVVCLFFLVYPKIHSGYYMLPLALLLPYMVDDRNLYTLTILMFGTVVATFKFADGTLSFSGMLVAIPIALAIATDIMLIILIKNTILRPSINSDRTEGMPSSSSTVYE